MKISRTILTTGVVTCVIATTVFASGSAIQSNKFTVAGSVYSSSTQNQNGNKNFSKGRHMGKMRDPGGSEKRQMGGMVDLVKAGTITEEQAVAVKKSMAAVKTDNKTMKEELDALVKAGTITQAQEDAIVKTMPMMDKKMGGFKGGFKGQFKNPLADLVTAKTITQEQADAVIKAMKAAMTNKKTTKEEIDTLVKAGTITQAQEDVITKAMPMIEGKVRGFGGMCKDGLADLVTAGTITQAQLDAVKNALASTKSDNKTVKAEIDALVKAGTITQAQEDSIVKAMPMMGGKMAGKMRGMRHGWNKQDDSSSKQPTTSSPKSGSATHTSKRVPNHL